MHGKVEPSKVTSIYSSTCNQAISLERRGKGGIADQFLEIEGFQKRALQLRFPRR
jgi:hypothetical protein